MTLSLTGSIQKKYEYSDYGERSLDSKTEIINNEFGYNGEAHARNKQNAFTVSLTLLVSTNKAPAKETVVPKEVTKSTGLLVTRESKAIADIMLADKNNGAPVYFWPYNSNTGPIIFGGY